MPLLFFGILRLYKSYILKEHCFVNFLLFWYLFMDISDIETNECLDNNGGCWQDKAANVTACKVLYWL